MFREKIVINLFLSLCLLLLLPFIQTESVSLTNKTWKDMLYGQWMVEFYAPWCPACERFSSIWEQYSKEMIQNELKVAKVDINEYPSLSGRFRISLLPTIYYVRGGIFREYNGERSLNGLKAYIEHQEWQRTKPVRWYLAPDSFLMSIVSGIFELSFHVKQAYYTLLVDYFWPSWLIYITFALIVIILGLCVVFGVLLLIDYCSSSTPTDYSNIPDDLKEELDDNEIQQQTIYDHSITEQNKNTPSSNDITYRVKTQNNSTISSNNEIESNTEDDDQDEEAEEEVETGEDEEEMIEQKIPDSYKMNSDLRHRHIERKNE